MKNWEAVVVMWIIVGGILTATYKFNWFVGHDVLPMFYGATLGGFFGGMFIVDIAKEYTIKIVKKEEV